MTSTGNDIVALKAINIARTKQPNFYWKILSVSEKDLYDQQFSGKIPFENFVWLCWSIKESAYKFLHRTKPNYVFSPTRTIINLLELPAHSVVTQVDGQAEGCGFDDGTTYNGMVSINDQKLYSRSLIGEDFILSVVSDLDNFDDTCWGVQHIPSSESAHQSATVREFLMKKLSQLLPGDSIHIDKNKHGIPVLVKDKVEMPHAISLAHHDHYVAYSLRMTG
jgi:phosphopantetheinyl transferase (holo-ACP synthase)